MIKKNDKNQGIQLRKILPIFLILSTLLFIGIPFIIYKIFEDEGTNYCTDSYFGIRFDLYDQNATYKVIKTQDGFYMMQYTIGKGYSPNANYYTDDTRTAYIGSSKVD